MGLPDEPWSHLDTSPDLSKCHIAIYASSTPPRVVSGIETFNRDSEARHLVAPWR